MKVFLCWWHLPHHICEEHFHTQPVWRCTRPFSVNEGQEGCPQLNKTGQHFSCSWRVDMWSHLMSGHGHGLLDSLVGLHDLQFNPQKKGKRAVAFTNCQCPDYVFGRETLLLQKQHRLIALYLFNPSTQELGRDHFRQGRRACSAQRGRGRGMQAVTHSQSASGHHAAGKKPQPGKGKSGQVGVFPRTNPREICD